MALNREAPVFYTAQRHASHPTARL